MATKVYMEALSPTMEEGQLVSWLKAEGDSIASGDVLAEIETDKATMELVARGDGVLRQIFLPAGGTTAVGNVIAVIAAADEDISEIVAAAAAGTPPAEAAQAAGGSPEVTEAVDVAEAEAPVPEAAVPAGGGRVKASPLARRMAEDSGVDIGAVSGSGPGGRVTKKDVQAAIEGGGVSSAPAAAPAAAAAAPQWAAVPAESGADFEDVPLSQMRKAIAKRLVQSIGPIPHFFLTIDIDMTRLQEARARINALLEADGLRVSVNDLIIRATAAALRRHPECNAHWLGDKVRRFNRVHIGVAVAIPDGLITPIVRDAHAKGVAQIGAEVRELAGRAREKKLLPDEYTGATFSISNLGMLGIHEFTAVINPPEAAILAVGGVVDTPVIVEGELEAQPRMRVTMSCDHRVIDGAQGARFLATLKAMLEEPAAIIA